MYIRKNDVLFYFMRSNVFVLCDLSLLFWLCSCNVVMLYSCNVVLVLYTTQKKSGEKRESKIQSEANWIIQVTANLN